MRVFKPQYLTPLVSVFDDGRRLHCVVTAIFHTTFGGELREERELWEFATNETEGQVLDEAKPKTRGEYLVHGSCFARGPDVRQSFVKVAIGKQEKALAVSGARTFLRGALSEPEPFDSVPIRFSNAFGGPTYPDNPLGTGFGGTSPPQVEARGELITREGERPPVGGFGRVDVTWPQRMKRMGTYDDRYMKTRYPGVAEDFDGSFFQLSQQDQWRDDFFEGTEEFSVVNMHPEHEQLDGRLPGMIARAFVKRTGEDFVDVAMRIDTIHLYPHRERQVIVCRGTTSTKSDTLMDIAEVGFGIEWIGRPKPRSHYEDVFAARRNKRGGVLASLSDVSLIPEEALPPKKKERLVAPTEGLKQQTIERRIQHRIDEIRKTMVENGLDTSELDKVPMHIDTSVDPDSIPAREGPPSIDSINSKIAAKKAETIAGIRAKSAQSGASSEQLKEIEKTIEKIEKGLVGPPAFSRDKTRERLEDQATLLRNAGMNPGAIEAQLNDPALDKRMREMEAFVRESYRKHVHSQGVAPPLGGDGSEAIRAMVLARVKNGESLTGVDLTGADLSGLDLRGAKMSRGFLESVDLTGAKLDDADLEFAVLARAKLRGVDLTRCRVVGINLSEAELQGADLTGTDLSGSFFVGANLTDAKLADTKLDRADFGRATLLRTDFSGSTAERLKLRQLRLESVSIRGARWERASIYECEIVALDARKATLPNLSLVDTAVEGSAFDDAVIPKLRVARALGKSSISNCSFIGATLHRAHFRGLEMPGCDFRHADLSLADFSEAFADDSTFEDARAVGSRFMGASIRRCKFDRADLMEALLSAALLEQTSFEEANLYRADMGRSQGEGVKMTGANVKWVRTIPKRDESA